MHPDVARIIWHHLEPLNAVAYFSPECIGVPTQLGLRGFWMGYFASRAAPMGAVSASVVEATFFNFHPGRVRRAIPEAWSIVPPDELVAARASAASTALRRLLSDPAAERLAIEVLPSLHAAIDTARGPGHPLFAANRAVDEPADPVAALWQAATTLREHRGDGHVNLLAGSGLDGCEAHVLFAATEAVPPELLQQSRGWSTDDWRAATERLSALGLVHADGTITGSGQRLREHIEARTDELALAPYAALGDESVDTLLHRLGPPAQRVVRSGEIQFPNPMGLPAIAAPN